MNGKGGGGNAHGPTSGGGGANGASPLGPVPSAADDASWLVDEDDGTGEHPVDGLTARQQRAIVALINEPTPKAAAKAAEVGERTIHTWLRDGKFARAYRAARREAFGHAIAMTQRYAPHAVQTLAKIMLNEAAPYPSRVQAAANLLKFGRESIELDELAGRIEALESAAASQENRR